MTGADSPELTDSVADKYKLRYCILSTRVFIAHTIIGEAMWPSGY